jgi:hypothetical protein
MPSISTLMTTLLAVASTVSAGEFTGCTDKNYKGVCGKWSASHDTCSMPAPFLSPPGSSNYTIFLYTSYLHAPQSL